MKRTLLKRRSPLKRKKTKRQLEKYRPPKWFNKIPTGSHGNTPAQKRLWKLISDKYRQEDYEFFGGRCPLCGKPIDDWKQLDLGHFHRYSLCNSWFKFERRNLLGICKGCNINDGGITSYKFAERLRQMYGEDVILWIEKENEKFRGMKMETWQVVDMAARLSPEIVE